MANEIYVKRSWKASEAWYHYDEHVYIGSDRCIPFRADMNLTTHLLSDGSVLLEDSQDRVFTVMDVNGDY